VKGWPGLLGLAWVAWQLRLFFLGHSARSGRGGLESSRFSQDPRVPKKGKDPGAQKTEIDRGKWDTDPGLPGLAAMAFPGRKHKNRFLCVQCLQH